MAARLVSGIPIPLSSFSFRGRESSSQVGHLSFLSLLAVVCAVLRLAPAAMQSTHDHMTALPWVSLHSAAPCSVSDAVAHTPQHSCSACISLGRLRCRAPAAGACMNSLSVVSFDCAASTPRQYRCASIVVLQPFSSSPLRIKGQPGAGRAEGGRAILPIRRRRRLSLLSLNWHHQSECARGGRDTQQQDSHHSGHHRHTPCPLPLLNLGRSTALVEASAPWLGQPRREPRQRQQQQQHRQSRPSQLQ